MRRFYSVFLSFGLLFSVVACSHSVSVTAADPVTAATGPVAPSSAATPVVETIQPFSFPTHSPLTKTLARNAAFEAYFGEVDNANSGGVAVLNDGLMPRSDREGRGNFFFTDDTTDGRILITLQQPTKNAVFHSYSWHRDPDRANQKYILYGLSNKGAAAAATQPSVLRPTGSIDGTCWDTLAQVDTLQIQTAAGVQHIQAVGPGGVYGVTVTCSGTYTYLLMVISQSSATNPVSTYYSEVTIESGPDSMKVPRIKTTFETAPGSR